ncbi:MAG TPA: TonB-dependent receptor [Mucilaginibacter sp.]|nr:TonB-dependent receptor [Mucilaginibacter sp.]
MYGLSLKISPAYFLIIFGLLASPGKIVAQTNRSVLKGSLSDNNGAPLINLEVMLKRNKKTTVTDGRGNFEFVDLSGGKDTLTVASVDLTARYEAVVIPQNGLLDIGVISLSYRVKELQEVEIKATAANSYKSDYSFFSNKTETSLLKIPQSVSTVTKALIEDKMEFTLKDAVEGVAGVNQYSGFDEYTIRGFRAENARDINGLRGYNTTYTSSMLVNIERVEVVKGPTATLYGNCDPGGTINLVTKKPLDKNAAEINLYTGSWNHYRAEADVTGPLNVCKTLLYRFNAGYDNKQSFRSHIYARSYELAPSLSFVPGEQFKINLDFSVSHTGTVLDRGQPAFKDETSLTSTPISLTLVQPGDHLHETDLATNITTSWNITKNLNLSIGYLNYTTKQRVAEHGLNDYISPDSVYLYYTTWSYHTATNTLSSYLTYKLKKGGIENLLTAGYDYIRSRIDLTQQYYEQPDIYGEDSGIVGTLSLKNPAYLQRPVSTYKLSVFDSDDADVDAAIYHTQGVYLQDQLSIRKWTVSASLRAELYRGSDGITENVFLPRIGLLYAIRPNISVYGAYNNGFDPFEASTELQVFNEPFKPLKSRLFEAGLKTDLFANRLYGVLAVYQLTVQNVAVNANDISNPDLFVQRGANRSRGIEAEATGSILSNLSISLSYAYCKAVISKSTDPEQVGKAADNAPKNISGSWIKYTFDKGFIKGFGLMAGHSSVSSRNTLNPDVLLPGYLIFNGGAFYKYDHLKIAMNFNNITNKTYWTSAYNNVNKWPGAPANVMLNIGYKL